MALEGQLYPIGYLPTATENQLGVVKIGSGVNIAVDGTLSVTPGVIARETKTLITSVISVGNHLQTNLVINKSFHCLSITSDKAARIRVYLNSTYQAADVGRAIIADLQEYLNFAATDNGLIWEGVTEDGWLTINVSAGVFTSIPGSTLIPITVTNLSDTDSTISLNFVIIPIE